MVITMMMKMKMRFDGDGGIQPDVLFRRQVVPDWYSILKSSTKNKKLRAIGANRYTTGDDKGQRADSSGQI